MKLLLALLLVLLLATSLTTAASEFCEAKLGLIMQHWTYHYKHSVTLDQALAIETKTAKNILEANDHDVSSVLSERIRIINFVYSDVYSEFALPAVLDAELEYCETKGNNSN